nr:TrkA family potassium uptake protein [Desertimonas flava]
MHTLGRVHVIVVGCGRVGSALSQQLLDDGHTVAIIDRRAEAFRRLPDDFRGQKIQGIGFDRDRLVEAGVEQAGAVAAVTNGDNSNVLIARVARETFGIERVVARIYDPRRAAIYQRLGLATVATVAWTTDQVMRRLLPDPTGAEWTDPTAAVSIVERSVTKSWVGRTITEFEEETGTRVAAVGRMGAALVASDKTVAQEGDLLYIAVAVSAVAEVDARLQASPAGSQREAGH